MHSLRTCTATLAFVIAVLPYNQATFALDITNVLGTGIKEPAGSVIIDRCKKDPNKPERPIPEDCSVLK